jgi:holo-[acyl-carrier protein] synthase
MDAVGSDPLEIERLERALERRPRLAERLFADGERAYAETRTRPAMHLAARFCAKEAVAKGLSLRERWRWRPESRPQLIRAPQAARPAGR